MHMYSSQAFTSFELFRGVAFTGNSLKCRNMYHLEATQMTNGAKCLKGVISCTIDTD